MKKKLFTLMTLLLCLCSGAWADPTYHTVTPNISGKNYEAYQIYDAGTSCVIKAKKTTLNSSFSTWVTGGIYDYGGSNYSIPSGVTAANWLSASGKGAKIRDDASETALVFYVTNCVGVTVLGKAAGSSGDAKKLTISVKKNGVEVGSIASDNNTNVHELSYGSKLSASDNYVVTVASSGANNCEFYQIRFETPSCTDVAAPTGLSCTAHTKNSLTFEWTAAENASKYTATLYSNSECTGDPVATTSDISSISVTFSGLSGSTTYYCKVQSNGDGSTYCAEGGITSAATGTTDGKDYTVSAQSNNNEWGSAAAEAGSLDEGEKTNVTATANDGYKFVSWAVEGAGATLSSTTANPTELTMGTENATVTATFRALYTYAIIYDKGANGTGTIDAGEKTEDVAFTLSSEKFTRDGFIQTGWSLTDGGEKAFELGGTYTTNAAQTFYPFWTANYSLTYDANGGTGTMSDTKGVGNITLTHNAYTKSGYTFVGWATSQDNADAGTVAYADKASYPLSTDATIYAVWGENDTYLVPATSGDAPSSGDLITMQSGSFGGSITALSSNLTYTTNGLQFGTNSSTMAKVTLDRNMQEGSIIVMTFVSAGTGSRGLHIYTNAASPAKVTSVGWSNATNGEECTFTYTVKNTDTGLIGTNVFQLWRNNTVQLKAFSVINLVDGWTITDSGWNSFSCNSNLDLSTISGGEAYVASATSGNTVTLTPVTDKIVAAGTGLMIKGTAGEAFTIDATSAAATFEGTNLLVGMPNGGEVAKANNTDTWNYVFGWTDPTDPGFFLVNNTLPTLGAGKAYLQTNTVLSTGTPARLNIVFDSETTAINGIEEVAPVTKTRKVIKNGRLVIETANGEYSVSGARVK